MSASSSSPTTPRPARLGPSLPALVVAVVAAVLIVVFLLVPMVRTAREKRAEVLDTNAKLTVSQSAETLRPGRRTCVRHLDVELPRVDIRVFPGFAAAQAPPLQVTVRDAAGAALARGTATRYANAQPLAVPIDVGRARRDTTVCLRNAGRDPVTLAHAVLPQEGRTHLPVRIDVSTRPFTTVDRVPVALTRAAYFKSGIVSRPLIAALCGIVLALVLVVLVLLVRGRGDGAADA